MIVNKNLCKKYILLKINMEEIYDTKWIIKISEFTRSELLTDFDQLLEKINKNIYYRYDSKEYIYREKFTVHSTYDNVRLAYKLKKIFDENNEINKIIIIYFSISGIGSATVEHYALYMSDNYFTINTFHGNNYRNRVYYFSYPPNNFNDYDNVEFIKDLLTSYDYIKYEDLRKNIYFIIYKYYKEYIGNPLLKKTLSIYPGKSMSTSFISNEHLIENQLKWDTLKHYLYHNKDKVIDYIEKNKYDISLLINTINEIYINNPDLFNYSNMMIDWISEYLNWYNDQGKEIISKTKCVEVTKEEFKLNIHGHKDRNKFYEYKWNDKKLTDIYKDNFYFIDKYVDYSKTSAHYEYDIKPLIKQLYYYLAQAYANELNLKEDDKIKLLFYIDKAGDYRDAKELKKKLFFQYIGLSLGQNYDLEFDKVNIVTLYNLAKIIKKYK